MIKKVAHTIAIVAVSVLGTVIVSIMLTGYEYYRRDMQAIAERRAKFHPESTR